MKKGENEAEFGLMHILCKWMFKGLVPPRSEDDRLGG